MKPFFTILILFLLFKLNYCQNIDSLDSKKSDFNKLLNNDISSLIGKKLPSFELYKLNGEPVNSVSLLGKPAVLNFWFIHCPPCLAEMPVLNNLKNDFEKQVNFIAFGNDSEEEIESFLKRKRFDFLHIINAAQYAKEQLGLVSYPVTFVLDKNLVIRHIEKAPNVLENNKIKADTEFKNRISIHLNKLVQQQ